MSFRVLVDRTTMLRNTWPKLGQTHGASFMAGPNKPSGSQKDMAMGRNVG